MKVIAVRYTKVLTQVVLVAATQPALADASSPLVDTLASIITRERPLRTPMLALGGGFTTEGTMPSIAAGYAWGTRDRGIVLPGVSLKRVMFGARSNLDNTLLRATGGYYTNIMGVMSADVGVEAQVTGTRAFGPVLQSMMGWRGIGLRYSVGALIGSDVRYSGSVELVIEVMELTGRL